jgi:hypothetical protein
MPFRFLTTILCLIWLSGAAHAGERIDLIPGSSGETARAMGGYVLDASWRTADPLGEFDPSLGAAAALNQALGLYFSGYASPEQLQVERELTDAHPEACKWAPFAKAVLDRLDGTIEAEFPEPVELVPFDLAPSEPPVVSPDDPHIVIMTYDNEEYLERLLQRLYFKLIQGPVLLTVPYRGDAESVPEEYRNWNNFRYVTKTDTVVWNEVRKVYVDWDLTQTVVLRYEDGKIACYDSGRKYYIDHSAAVTEAGAMLAHPRFHDLAAGNDLNFILVSKDQG